MPYLIEDKYGYPTGEYSPSTFLQLKIETTIADGREERRDEENKRLRKMTCRLVEVLMNRGLIGPSEFRHIAAGYDDEDIEITPTV